MIEIKLNGKVVKIVATLPEAYEYVRIHNLDKPKAFSKPFREESAEAYREFSEWFWKD